MSSKKVKDTKTRKTPDKNQHLQVFVRCRPLNNNESNNRNHADLEILGPNDISIRDSHNSKITKTFSFNKVFAPASSQSEVYLSVVEPLISDVLSGFNCTVFAYGQTGSGKTYTMEGEIIKNKLISEDSKAGLIPRAMCALFDELHVLYTEYTVRISFMEIYNEEIYDLLSPDEVPPKLRLFDDATKKGSVIIHGLQEVMVHTQTQVLDELHKGCTKRQSAVTLLNAHSSRSHSIFCVTVHTKENSVHGEELLKTGKLYFVDLAGSENIGRSGAVDKRAREAGNINQSLLALGRVITCLVDRHPHVPYRESKLTRILQDSLGGRTKTSMIATISSAYANVEETLSTLDYAHKAMSVTNKPQVNQKVSQKVVMKEYMDVIEDLKKKLDLHRNGSGVYLNSANYQQITQQTRESNLALSETIAEIRAVHQQFKTMEETCAYLALNVENQKRNLENTEKMIEKTSEKICIANDTLAKAKNEKEEAGDLLAKVEWQENELRNKSKHLIEVIDASQSDNDKIHNRLDRTTDVLQRNRTALENFSVEAKSLVRSAEKMIDYVMSAFKVLETLETVAVNFGDKSIMNLNTLIQVIESYKEKTLKCMEKVKVTFHKVTDFKKRNATACTSNITNFGLMILQELRDVEHTLSTACTDFHQIMSLLPQQSSSLINYLEQSVVSIKDALHLQCKDVSQTFSHVHSQAERDTHSIQTLLIKLQEAEKKPYREMKNHSMMLRESVSTIVSTCLRDRESFNAHKVKLLADKEEIRQESSVIKQLAANSVEYLKKELDEVPAQCHKVVDLLSTHLKPCVVGVQTRTQSMKECLENSLDIVNRAKEASDHFIMKDDQSLPIQILDETRNITNESTELNDGLVAVKDWLGASADICQIIPSKFEENKKSLKMFEHEEGKSFEEFIGMMDQTNTEIQQSLDSRKSSIREIVHSELRQDICTGQTPVKKSDVTIPEIASLPSPIMRTVKARVQNAIASNKRVQRQLRIHATISTQDYEDECMASDPEPSSPNRPSELYGLKKASSISDLRSETVFQRPRIPKKFVRKAIKFNNKMSN